MLAAIVGAVAEAHRHAPAWGFLVTPCLVLAAVGPAAVWQVRRDRSGD